MYHIVLPFGTVAWPERLPHGLPPPPPPLELKRGWESSRPTVTALTMAPAYCAAAVALQASVRAGKHKSPIRNGTALTDDNAGERERERERERLHCITPQSTSSMEIACVFVRATTRKPPVRNTLPKSHNQCAL